MFLSKALITGSNNGLGYFIAQYFLKKGHSVILHGRNEDKLNKVHQEFLDKD